jgi:hypothetical protein
MDILAGILAYVAGIVALFAGLAISFSFFLSTPHEPLQTQAAAQSASAMLVRPSAPRKPVAVEAHAKQRAKLSAAQSAGHSDQHAAAAGSPGSAQASASARDVRGKNAQSTAQARRLIQEGRARRWAYQQDSSFESRFLGYAD